MHSAQGILCCHDIALSEFRALECGSSSLMGEMWEVLTLAGDKKTHYFSSIIKFSKVLEI